MTSRNEEDEIVWYCTRCLALDVRTEDNVTYCPHCYRRKNPSTIDFAFMSRWEELYLEKYGHPLIEKKTIYDDVKEAFDEDAIETINEFDALNNNLIVREKMNLNLNRLKE